MICFNFQYADEEMTFLICLFKPLTKILKKGEAVAAIRAPVEDMPIPTFLEKGCKTCM